MRKFRYLMLMLIVCSFISSCFGCNEVKASTGVGRVEEFDNLDGDGKYLGKDYVDNYSLDTEKCGILDTGDSMVNKIANAFFSFFTTIGQAVCSLFYFAMKFDITDLLGDEIDGLQKAMSNSIFEPLFIFAFCGSAFIMLKRLIKQDLVGVIGQLVKVIGIVVLSVVVVNDTSTVLSNTTTITKGISVDMLTEVNSSMGIKGEGSSYAANAAGVLWGSLIHMPWKSLEFESATPDEETVQKILASKPGSSERADLIKEYKKKNKGTFDKGAGAGRIGLLLAYFIPFLVKSGIYIVIAMIQIVFQLLALFFVLMAPLVLILAMIPGYETVIETWLKKIFETQVSILILTFIMALLIKLDISCYKLIPEYGWFVGMIFQLGMGIGLFLARNKILHVFTNLQKGVGNPRILQMQLRKMGNPYKNMENVQHKLRVANSRNGSTKGHYKKSSFSQYKQSPRMDTSEHPVERIDQEKANTEIRPRPSTTKATTKRNGNGKVNTRSGTENAGKQVSKPIKRPQTTARPVPSYSMTETSYNQIDTSDLHSLWENAVPKEQLKPIRPKMIMLNEKLAADKHPAKTTPRINIQKTRNAGNKIVVSSRTQEEVRANSRPRSAYVGKNSGGNRVAKAVSSAPAKERPRTCSKTKKAVVEKGSKPNVNTKANTRGNAKANQDTFNANYPEADMKRPIICNGKEIERPVMNTAKAAEKAIDKKTSKKGRKKISKKKTTNLSTKASKNKKSRKTV